MAKKKPTDATLRNVKAAHQREQALKRWLQNRIDKVANRVTKLERLNALAHPAPEPPNPEAN